MKILFEHSSILPVKEYGGTERIIYWLMKELVIFGHEVYYIGDKRCELDSIGVHLIDRSNMRGPDFRHLIPQGIDLIHMQVTPGINLSDYPYVATVHGNGKVGEEFSPNSIFISKKHASNHGGGDVYVYNGIDFSEYPYCPRKERGWLDFMFLAKASWKVKNLSHCIKVCKKNKKHLHIAGGKAFSFSTFIHSHGMVKQSRKLELLRSVDALLFPVRWHEPFGIAIIEAFSQGLPVIGSNFGSLSELINSQVGFCARSYQELDEYISKGNNNFSSDVIRNYAENSFSSKQMAEGYLAYYKKVIAGETLHQIIPKTVSIADPEALLDF